MKASILALTISTALSANAFAQSTKVDIAAANAATHELIGQQMRDIDASVQAQLAAKYADAQPGDIAVIEDVVYEQQSNGTWAAVGTASAALVAGLLTTSSSSSSSEDDATPSLPVYTQPDNDLPNVDDGSENTPPTFNAPTMNAKFHYEDGEFKNTETGQRVAYVDDRHNVVVVKEDGTRTKVGKVSHIEDSNAPTTIEFNNGAVVTLDKEGQPNDIVRANGDVYGWTADGGFYLKPIDEEIEHTPTPDNDLPNVDMPTQEGIYSLSENNAILIDGNETGYYISADSNDASYVVTDGNQKVADVSKHDTNGKSYIVIENDNYNFVIDASTGKLVTDPNYIPGSDRPSQEGIYSLANDNSILIDGNETGLKLAKNDADNLIITDENGREVGTAVVTEYDGQKVIAIRGENGARIVIGEDGKAITPPENQIKQKLQNIDQNKLKQVKAKVQNRLATLKK